MAILWLLTDSGAFHLSLVASKIIASEIAIINNFLWNDIWTFHDMRGPGTTLRSHCANFFRFNVICVLGMILNVAVLVLFRHTLKMNLYLANAFAIGIVTLWNFSISFWYRWGKKAGFPAVGFTQSGNP